MGEDDNGGGGLSEDLHVVGNDDHGGGGLAEDLHVVGDDEQVAGLNVGIVLVTET